MTEFRCDTCQVTVFTGAVWVTNGWIRATLEALATGTEPRRARWRVGCGLHSAPAGGDVYDLSIWEAGRPLMVEHLASKRWAAFTVWPDGSAPFGLTEAQWQATPLELREAS
jgi:hypothetical protein